MTAKRVISTERNGVTVFCPKCGGEMRAKFDGRRLSSAECPVGRMPFSIKLTELIDRAFFSDSSSASVEARLMAPSRWYCPRDGASLWQSGPLSYTCPDCGRRLTSEAVYHLVELHPHDARSR